MAAAVFRYDPSREKGFQESPQTFLKPEIKNNLSADDAQSNAERIQNRPVLLRLATGGEAVYNSLRTLQRRNPRLI